MVHLGLIKDAEDCDATFLRVVLNPAAKGQAAPLSPVVRSWPDEEGVQLFELCLEVTPGVDAVKEWAPVMAEVISKMGWDNWCLDVNSVSMVLNRYLTDALGTWGSEFWPHYDKESVVLLQAGLQREPVMMSVQEWEASFSTVKHSTDYDFDAQEREQIRQSRERSKKLKSLFKPRFMARQRTT